MTGRWWPRRTATPDTRCGLVRDVDRPDERPQRRAAYCLLLEMLRPHRRQLAVGAGCMVVSTAGTLAVPYLVKYGIDSGVTRSDNATVLTAVVLIILAGATAAGFQRIAVRLFGGFAESATHELRVRLWRHVQTLSIDFFDGQRRGQVVARMTNDLEAVYGLLSTASLTVVPNLLLMVGIAVVIFTLDVVLAFAIMLSVFPFVLATMWAFTKHSTRTYRVTREKLALVVSHLTDTLTGIRALQAFSRESVNQTAFEEQNQQHFQTSLKAARLYSGYWPFLQFLGHCSLFLVVVVGGYRAIDGKVTVGVIAALVLYLRQFFEPLLELSQFHQAIQAATAGLERAAALFATKPSLTMPPNPAPLLDVRGELRLEGITFGYQGSPTVLHDVDLAVKPGETLALIGETGAGKSTLAKLIARFYDPVAGRVLLDGRDIRDVSLTELRGAVGLVPQEPYLFHGSIHENIALGRPDASAEEVCAAARVVGAHGFIAALPDGYETDVKKRGIRLSGGQRQLVSLARACLAAPRVLILDEATSFLDMWSERSVLGSLEQFFADRTAVIIAHRLSAVDIADRIAVAQGGRIVELGTRQELLSYDGHFRGLHVRWEGRDARAAAVG